MASKNTMVFLNLVILVCVKHTAMAEMMLITAKVGSRKESGGVLPIRISLIIPPPTAVVTASIITPKMSSFFSIPMSAPDMAKAIVPIISKLVQTNIAPPLYELNNLIISHIKTFASVILG
ncbi:hypothetical protein SDC9_143930 [bioreactor metagenome]|uniref:Uncharacterized protein n=1 Tax=bioreactor metagenome TaxID=1076179 RepID=A0A645E5I5_9ZZZZ